jgi:hypothetical protein
MSLLPSPQSLNLWLRQSGTMDRAISYSSLINPQFSTTSAKVEFIYTWTTERTWANTIIIYFTCIFTKYSQVIINFFWYYFFIAKSSSHLIYQRQLLVFIFLMVLYLNNSTGVCSLCLLLQSCKSISSQVYELFS